MAVLQKVKEALDSVPLWAKALMAAGIFVIAVSAFAGNHDDSGSSDKYKSDRAFCEKRATDEARATDGLHSVGGDWWVDRVNDCLVNKD